MNPIHPYNFNNINNSSVNNLPEPEKDAEMSIDELSHLNLGNLPEQETDAEMCIDTPISQGTTIFQLASDELFASLVRIQEALLQITKIFVQESLSDEVLQDIEKVVKILYKKRGILISELKKRGEL